MDHRWLVSTNGDYLKGYALKRTHRVKPVVFVDNKETLNGL